MINLIMEMYSHYNLRYDVKDKILFIYKPMLVKDFVNLKNIIREYNVDIQDIRIIGR